MLDAGAVRIVAGICLALTFAGVAVLAAYRGRLEDEVLRSPQAFGDLYRARTGRSLPRLRRPGR